MTIKNNKFPWRKLRKTKKTKTGKSRLSNDPDSDRKNFRSLSNDARRVPSGFSGGSQPVVLVWGGVGFVGRLRSGHCDSEFVT